MGIFSVNFGDVSRWLFRDPEGRLDRPLLLVFVVVNGLVLLNAVLHDPAIEYDFVGHWDNIAVLSGFHLPVAGQSSEFFSPPLPYLLPALARAAGLSLWWAAKLGQIVNVVLSLGITGGLIALCRLWRPSDNKMALIALMCLGGLPVYYKSMAFVRGEPYVAFLTIAGIAATARAITSGRRPLPDAVLPGVCWGLLVLARQWGALAAGGMVIGVWLSVLRQKDRHTITIGLIAPLVALLVGGWFYGWLWLSQGSPIAFNRFPAAHWSFQNQPAEFYIGTGNGRLFTDPVRPSFPNQMLPILYTETWGDYWGYFSIYGRDPFRYLFGPEFEDALAKTPLAIETNRFTFNNYLGRVNLVGLLPTVLALLAFGRALVRLPAFPRRVGPVTVAEIVPIIAVLVTSVSVLGYGWFLVRFPSIGKGDTIKATYMLHIFAPLALLTADYLRRIPVPATGLLVAWAVLMMHNSLAVVTHYSWW
jgi:hypothetical protein